MAVTKAVGPALAIALTVGCAPQAQSQDAVRADRDPATARPATRVRPASAPVPTVPERLRVKVLETRPHDPSAFTQGLLFHQGKLYESNGNYGRSDLRRIDPRDGTVEHRVALPRDLFGEGLALVGERLVQITWKAGIVRSYDLATFDLLDERSYAGDGWGLAYDGEHLVMTNSSATLTFRDPESFGPLLERDVTFQGRPLPGLNELEIVDGVLYANVWGQEHIVRVDLETGHVTGVIDASGLLTPVERQRVDVLNGIAYDPASASFWITGKYWPKMFRVVFEAVAE